MRGLVVSAAVVIGLWMPGERQAQAASAGIMTPANVRPVGVLSQLDMDGDGVADNAPDSDGDGLPDNWEIGGNETSSTLPNRGDRLVKIPAPTAISPGTPPTSVFARLSVATRADSWDTDGDGLSDFVEVFGLKYIDDNKNGILDFSFTDLNLNGRWDPGEPIDTTVSEWLDVNGDGLPSIGEYPIANISPGAPFFRDSDFDGFVFTDPTLADTDGDESALGGGKGLDGQDTNPLINAQTFGVPVARGFVRPEANNASDEDLDNDGLGNGSDFANDLSQTVDYPTDINNLVRLFRSDLLELSPPSLPESLIEDLIGADWDGSGLFRLTDQRGFSLNMGVALDSQNRATLDGDPNSIAAQLGLTRFTELFKVGDRWLYGRNPALDYSQSTPSLHAGKIPGTLGYGERAVGMGAQLLLVPTGRTTFLPDERIWTILYAWRMPGFDADGDGYVGRPESGNAGFEFDDPRLLAEDSGIVGLDGSIAPPQCGWLGSAGAVSALVGLLGMRWLPSRRVRRRTISR